MASWNRRSTTRDAGAQVRATLKMRARAVTPVMPHATRAAEAKREPAGAHLFTGSCGIKRAMAPRMSVAFVCIVAVGCGAVIGCGAAPKRPTALGSGSAPASDLADARPTSPATTPTEPRPGSGSPDPVVIDLDTIRIQVVSRTPAGETQMTSVASADLFNGASTAWKNDKGDAAIGLFRRLVSDFPDSIYAPLALHNIAAIYDGRGDPTSTITTLRELIAAYPNSRQSVEGHLYIAAIELEHKQWSEAVTTLAQALTRNNLTFADRIEAGARRGYALLELGRLDEADAVLAAAVAEWRKAPYIEDPYFIAMAQYYRGEVAHRRFLAARVELPDDNLGKSLDAKTALAVVAYDRWREALTHRHAYWATASGYQMSQVFVELWEATVKAPFPVAMSRAARTAYVNEVHARVRADLQKALEGHQMNVQLAEAYGVSTSWSEASKTRAVQISEILAKEGSGQLVAPTP
jgi:tetratricopeptide (TPR) repeat protein